GEFRRTESIQALKWKEQHLLRTRYQMHKHSRVNLQNTSSCPSFYDVIDALSKPPLANSSSLVIEGYR
ncbi:MAG: hypothetical protein ACW97A_10210, partial [Candidatus Thorarchaeota archaeon]